MRKNSPRKWLHAILDLLPVLILPIFGLAVRSDNNFQPIEVQAQDYEIVDFNQLFNANNNYEYSTTRGLTTIENNIVTFNLQSGDSYNKDLLPNSFTINIPSGHKVYPKLVVTNGILTNSLFLYPSYLVFNEINTNPNSTSALHYYVQSVDSDINLSFYFNFFDLTQMFGSGNEPNKAQFDTWFNENYYDYTLSKKELLNVGTTTLNDTDVGSQMVYTLYNATDKYFNFNNVFNFGQIYDWFVLNIFNGNPSLIFPVVWNIVLYEFIMDLVFLIYALFMFFIDFCTNLIDRFHIKCSGGK